MFILIPGSTSDRTYTLVITRPIPYYIKPRLLLTFNVPVTKMLSTNVFNELCVKITLLRSIPNLGCLKCGVLPVIYRSDLYYSSSYVQPRDFTAPITRGMPKAYIHRITAACASSMSFHYFLCSFKDIWCFPIQTEPRSEVTPKPVLGMHSPIILKNVLSFVLQIFLYLAAFECQ